MSRLRKPIRAIREPFGTAGLLVAVVALIFALAGGAYAANQLGANASKAKQGPRGKTGKTGPAGPVGPQGAPGPKGDPGGAGANGTNGTSATTESFTGSAHAPCTAGGVVVKSAGPEVAVCNGKNGTNGVSGFTETLPEGQTETGAWAAEGAEGAEVFTPISFPIPLEGESAVTQAQLIKPGETPPTGCSGTIKAPAADPGNLCVFAGEIGANLETALIGNVNGSFSPPLGGPGALMLVIFKAGEGAGSAAGSWAVTAP